MQLEGVVAAAAKCDVTQKQEVEQLVAWTVETYGSLDIMVANAGVVKGADFLDFSEEDWDDVLNVNLKGPFIVSIYSPSSSSPPIPKRISNESASFCPPPLGFIITALPAKKVLVKVSMSSEG